MSPPTSVLPAPVGSSIATSWSNPAKFSDVLVDRGVIILGGPIGSANDEDVALLAVEAADEDELRSIFAEDPWALNGILRLKEVPPWTWWLDGR